MTASSTRRENEKSATRAAGRSRQAVETMGRRRRPWGRGGHLPAKSSHFAATKSDQPLSSNQTNDLHTPPLRRRRLHPRQNRDQQNHPHRSRTRIPRTTRRRQLDRAPPPAP